MSEVKEQANIFGSTEDLTWSLKDVRYVAQMLLNTANDLGLSEMKIGTLFLQAILDVTSDTWLPIDYSKADSGQGCFDGALYVVTDENRTLNFAHFDEDEGGFLVDLGVSDLGEPCNKPTHYRPIPNGWLEEVK